MKINDGETLRVNLSNREIATESSAKFSKRFLGGRDGLMNPTGATVKFQLKKVLTQFKI
jgi:aldehyde:ferredoxin oxidoreductase